MNRYLGKKQEEAGFTLVEIMMVVAIVALLATMAIPSYVWARSLAQSSTCVNNLRQINGGTDQWVIENNKVDTDTVSTAAADPICSIGGPHVLP